LGAVQFGCLEEALAALRLGRVKFRCCLCGRNHLSISEAARRCAEKMWRGMPGTLVRRSEQVERLILSLDPNLFVFAPWLGMPREPAPFVEMPLGGEVYTAVVASLGLSGSWWKAREALVEFLAPAIDSWREEAARQLADREAEFRQAVLWLSEAAEDMEAWFRFVVRTCRDVEPAAVSSIEVVPRRQGLPSGVQLRRVNGYEWAHRVAITCGIPCRNQYLVAFRYGRRKVELDIAEPDSGKVATLVVPFREVNAVARSR